MIITHRFLLLLDWVVDMIESNSNYSHYSVVMSIVVCTVRETRAAAAAAAAAAKERETAGQYMTIIALLVSCQVSSALGALHALVLQT